MIPKNVKPNDAHKFLASLEKKKDISNVQVRFNYIGQGETVIDQLPEAGITLSEEGKVWIYLGEDTFE